MRVDQTQNFFEEQMTMCQRLRGSLSQELYHRRFPNAYRESTTCCFGWQLVPSIKMEAMHMDVYDRDLLWAHCESMSCTHIFCVCVVKGRTAFMAGTKQGVQAASVAHMFWAAVYHYLSKFHTSCSAHSIRSSTLGMFQSRDLQTQAHRPNPTHA